MRQYITMSGRAIDSFCRYLPVDNKAINFGLYMTAYGCQTIASLDTYPPIHHPPKYIFDFASGRILPEFQLIFISDAKSDGIFETKQAKQCVPSNSFFLLTPDTWHRYKPDSNSGWTEYWVGFNGKIALNYFQNHSNILGNKVYTPKNFDLIKKAVIEFMNLLNSHADLSSGIIAANFFKIIAEIENVGFEKESCKKESLVESSFKERVKNLIWSWSHTDIRAQDIAKELNMTTRTLFKRVSKFKNFSVGREIDMCKISRAKELIATTNIPLKAIANLAGYRNVDAMRIVFMRELKLTPKQYRKNLESANV